MRWRAPLDTGLERRLSRLADLGERAFSVLLFAGLAFRLGFQLSELPVIVALLLSEGLVVVFMLFRRRPTDVSTRPLDWLVALLGTALPMLVSRGGTPLAPPNLAASLILAGALFALWGKLTLRRSYGLAAANRGVVQTGPYSFVRHPIYTGYVLTYIGFLLANPTWRNLFLYLFSLTLMVMRIGAEEQVLRLDPLYAAFKTRVRFRVAPGLY